jgi:hypothetical protein
LTRHCRAALADTGGKQRARGRWQLVGGNRRIHRSLDRVQAQSASAAAFTLQHRFQLHQEQALEPRREGRLARRAGCGRTSEGIENGR